MPAATLLLIIQAFQAAISAAPQIVALLNQAKEFFGTLFSAGLITRAQQDALNAHVDAVAAAAAAGQVPPEFQVEPDPEPEPAPATDAGPLTPDHGQT